MRRLIRESRGYTDALVHDVPKREQHRQQTAQQPTPAATPTSAKRKKSDAIKAKWKEKGLRIAGVQINDGMIYAGHNMADIPFPHIDEPSLLDPTFKVAEPSDKSSVKKLPQFPRYSEMTPEQRWCYIDFLAGDRSSCQDIGYAFVYLYGIERRLIVDTKKPDEVSEDERKRLVREIIRLMECFKSRSRSFYQYTTLLLLYDGTIFKMGYTNEEISSIFFDKTATKRFTYNENTDAYYQMAGVTRLSAELSSGGKTYIFLLEDPEGFEAQTGALQYLDGTVPDDPETTDADWREMVYRWTDCPVLTGLDLGGYEGLTLMDDVTGTNQSVLAHLYVGRRGVWDEKQVPTYEGCAELWDTLTAGAVSTAAE